MPKPSIAIRLGTEGGAETRREIEGIGTANEAAANRAMSAWDRASSELESAQRRQAAAAAKIAAIMPASATQMRIGDATGTGYGQHEGSARISAAAFREAFEAQERYEQGARRLRAAIDPVWAAQDRFNSEMAEARTLMASGSISLDEYSKKLWQEQQALNAVAAEHGRVKGASGAMRSGLQQAGFQVQDFFVQVQGGTSALRAFSQQAPQLIGNLQMMTHGAEAGAGRFAAFARLLGGPWGVAMGIAIPAVGMLAEKLLDDGKAAEAAQKATDKHRAAIDALNQAARASIQTAEDRARANYALAESERQGAIEIERKLQAQLALSRADLEYRVGQTRGPGTGRSDVSSAGIVGAQRQLDEVTDALKKSEARVAELAKTAIINRGQYQATIIDQMMDPRGRVKRDYDRQRNDAIESGKGADALVRIERARDAELKKIDESEKALRASVTTRKDSDAATTSQVSKMLLEAFGGTITSTTGGKHVKGSYHYRGQAVDFVPTGGMGSISKDQIRTLMQGAGLQIKELLGPGDKGHDDHFHVAWAGGKGQLDSARIMGQIIADQVRQSLAMEKQRNEWVNEQSTKVGDFASGQLDKEGKVLADRKEMVARLNDDVSAGTVLLNTEWQLRRAGNDEIQDTLEMSRYRLDLEKQREAIGETEYENLLRRKAEQTGFNRLLEDHARDWQEVTEFGRGFVDTVLSPDTWSSWGDAGKAIMREIQSEMMKLAVINPIKNALFGDGLPTLGSVAGLFGKKAGNNAVGTEYWSGGMSYVGEHGAELVDLPRGSKVYSARDTRSMMQGQSSHVTFEVRGLKGSTFDVEVALVADGRVAMAAPMIAAGGSQGAQVAVARRADRRLA
ncbi:hypothetical protein [Sphingobium aromaticiconvertens]|uniref:hypothetical protein n=1 Tax=Sphingobium aromaticiconvertens TaxID=365341 RepID=UPI003015AD53